LPAGAGAGSASKGELAQNGALRVRLVVWNIILLQVLAGNTMIWPK
jgi:hypothetical protein